MRIEISLSLTSIAISLRCDHFRCISAFDIVVTVDLNYRQPMHFSILFGQEEVLNKLKILSTLM